MIAVVDLKMGNLGSVVKAFRRLGASVDIVSKPSEIKLADKIVLPGVGHFSEGAKNLEPLKKALNKKAFIDRVPILGICLGMQLLGNSSEEGNGVGLGWIEGKNIRFKTRLKIPHMGWNSAKVVKKSPLFIPGNYYFAHSYHLACKDTNILMTTKYGVNFVSAVQNGNIYGVQFHPEKSHKQGLLLLKKFLNV